MIERDEAGGRVVTVKAVTLAEEYLQDHFATFPVLPGVMMLEAMVQAARVLEAAPPVGPRRVLGAVRQLKYGRFVQPGSVIRVEVEAVGEPKEGDVRSYAGKVILPGEADGEDAVAASGKFDLRPGREA